MFESGRDILGLLSVVTVLKEAGLINFDMILFVFYCSNWANLRDYEIWPEIAGIVLVKKFICFFSVRWL